MKRFALIELRQATADDFRTQITPGNYMPKWNVPYLEQHVTGAISRTVKYLTQETDKAQFKLLFEAGQIWVFAKHDEVARICIDEEQLEVSFEDSSAVKEIDFNLKNNQNGK